MRTNANKPSMSDTAHILVDKARVRAAYLVADQMRRGCGSKMAAYERVASMIGASSGWLRKFIGRSPDVRPDFVVGLNILSFYDRICTRVEQASAHEQALAAALRTESDEAIARGVDLASSATRAPKAGTDEG